MSGYGVELALKKTDYLVVDDRAAPDTTSAADVLGSRAGDATSGEDVFDNQLGEAPWTELSTPLTTAEVSGQSSYLVCVIKLEKKAHSVLRYQLESG